MPSLSDHLSRLAANELDIMQLLAAALELQQSNNLPDALTLYKAWLAVQPSHPMAHAAYFNLGFLHDAMGQREKSVEAFRRSIRHNPDFPPPYINLGNYLEAAGDRVGAAELWTELVTRMSAVTIENIEQKLTALKLLGRLFAEADLDRDAENALFRIIEIDPYKTDIMAYWLNMRQRQCEWDLLAPLPNAIRRLALKSMAPLSLLSHKDDPLWQLATSAAFTSDQIGRLPSTLPPPPPPEPGHRRLRVGYLSSDLCEHAVGYLTAEIYGLHDRAQVEVFAYYSGNRTDGATHSRIRAGVDHWRDVAPLTDEDAARLIAGDGIDILVDLNGHTKDARLGVLARGPAPIIVNWLGFPGTMGSAIHHYIIADEIIIPPGSERFFSETVLRLPCYQPVDRQRIVSTPPSRAELGLPEDAVVYCCFNEPRKISADSWASWMKILSAVSGSVLYLLVPALTTRTRLRGLAAAAGVSPDRLIFADRRLNPDHLARYPLVDIVLDTFAYGAHTTASDALWMGVPVVTMPGRSFAARVCASLVTAAGLPELVCPTPDAFAAKAIALGNDPSERARLRAKLRDDRDCLLFDTPSLVRGLEQLYRTMWDDYLAGRRPRPKLANMQLYQEMALDLELDGVPGTAFPESYLRELARRRPYTYFEADGRLEAET